MLTDQNVLQLIEQEFSLKTLGVTEQYLKIHQPEIENGSIKIERIDRDELPDRIIAYLPVQDEYFSFAVYIDPENQEIVSVGTEARNIVSLIATSDVLTSAQLLSFTKLSPSKTWNKGDFYPNKKRTHNNSGIEFTPNPEPDAFEDKLIKLLNFLEHDTEGIKKLSLNSCAWVDVSMDCHHGNQSIAGCNIDLSSVNKLSQLSLRISFSIWAWGEPFK